MGMGFVVMRRDERRRRTEPRCGLNEVSWD